MGYKILYGSELLLDPYTDDVVTDAKLTSSINTASYFDFTISPKHTLYNTILERAELVSVYFDKIKLFSGEITEIELDLEGYKSVTCTGVLDFLGDTVVRPYSTIEGEEDLLAPSSVDGYFQWLIDQHNEHCPDSSKQFVVDVNQGNMLDTNNYIYRASSQRPTTASEIENKILDSLGGYLFVRYKDDLNILDFYADAHEANTQIIDFGVNITDFTKTTSTDDQYTAVVATGYTPDPPEDDPDKEMKPITLEGCTDGGTPYSATIVKQGDKVYDVDAVARYGYKEYYASNDEIETYDGLLEYACKTLKSLLSPYLTVTVKAVDLAMYMDNGYEHLQLGQAARVRSKPHGLDEYLMVNSIDIDVNDPGNTEYTLGAGYDTLTGQQSSFLKSLNAGINSALDITGALSAETKAAAKNAQTALDTSDEAKAAADKAVVSNVSEYVQSDSAVEVPTEGWSTVPPTWIDGKYIWMRYVITYGSGEIETTNGVVLTGNTGAQGIQGIQGENGKDGVQGPPGADGATTYFHIKYAPVETPTADQMTETPDIYIGTYVDTTKEDSTDPGDYTWARFQGLQGEKGEQGIPGIGQDGKTSYLHIKYSDDGKTFTGNDGEDPGNYIGQYTDFTLLDSKVFSDYTWSLTKGETGDPGADGVSPTVDTSKSGTTTTITIVDAEGTKTATVEDGADGKDGKSPTATVTKSGTTSTITINNTDGTTTSVDVLDGSDGTDGKMLYGTCSTAAATAAKVATVSGFILTANTTVSITFTYANTAASPTLNINSLGAKSIKTSGVPYAYWAAGSAVLFVYDGTQFHVCSSPVYANTVTVGNPSSQNVYIDADSVDIRNGSVVGSSFSQSKIELGKTDSDADIEMRNGNFKIHSETRDGVAINELYSNSNGLRLYNKMPITNGFSNSTLDLFQWVHESSTSSLAGNYSEVVLSAISGVGEEGDDRYKSASISLDSFYPTNSGGNPSSTIQIFSDILNYKYHQILDPYLLWSGTLSAGGYITNVMVLEYSCFLIHTNKWEPFIGIRSPIQRSNPYTSGTGDIAYIITAFNSWDDSSSSYVGKATLTVSDTGKVTLISASQHLMASGVDGTSLTVQSIYGLF